LAHQTKPAGLSAIKGGDNRFFNNILIGTNGSPGVVNKDDPVQRLYGGYGLWVYDGREYPLQTGGNVSCAHAQPYGHETNQWVRAEFDPGPKLIAKGGKVFLRWGADPEFKEAPTTLVNTKLLGRAVVSGLPFENPDGSPLALDKDFFGRNRHPSKPTPGPFEALAAGPLELEVNPRP
jgi:alpha-L-arabinofuranosidase